MDIDNDSVSVNDAVSANDAVAVSEPPAVVTAAPSEPPPSYVKLAMRNMVRKRGKSLQHFFLTTAALLGMLVGLAYLTR